MTWEDKFMGANVGTKVRFIGWNSKDEILYKAYPEIIKNNIYTISQLFDNKTIHIKEYIGTDIYQSEYELVR